MEIVIAPQELEIMISWFFAGFFAWPVVWWLVSAIFAAACNSIDSATDSSIKYLRDEEK